jgi:hypothetical protein
VILETRRRLADGRREDAAHVGEITGETNDGGPATFNASGKAIEFPGYLRAYVEGSTIRARSCRPGHRAAEARGGDQCGRPTSSTRI